jgi:hypothetical protein
MQKALIAGATVALLVGAGFANTAQARCVSHGSTVSCRHLVRIHHHRYWAMHRRTYPLYGYGYYGGYGLAGYGSFSSGYGYDINHNNSKG